MKKTHRFCTLPLLIALLLCSLVSCVSIEDAEAEACVLGCLDAMARADYAAADAYFHPLAFTEGGFSGSEDYASLLASRHRIDLSQGYTVTESNGDATSSLRDAAYEYSFEGTVGGARVAVSAVLFRNIDGFGIFSLTVAPVKQAMI